MLLIFIPLNAVEDLNQFQIYPQLINAAPEGVARPTLYRRLRPVVS